MTGLTLAAAPSSAHLCKLVDLQFLLIRYLNSDATTEPASDPLVDLLPCRSYDAQPRHRRETPKQPTQPLSPRLLPRLLRDTTVDPSRPPTSNIAEASL
ncbi:hypothetical protein RJ55_07868 [Drechmeria coniospora]|nr:hypothetical protein RJ55_07868 [Drechmeria coniospora]